MDVDFRPSEVDVEVAFPPLVGTMRKAEAEFAAALYVRVCQEQGDVWKPVTWMDVEQVLRRDRDAKREPWVSLIRNPFFRPLPQEAINRGFARWAGEDAFELTPEGFEAIRRHVHKRDP